jgi:hypothetical protein
MEDPTSTAPRGLITAHQGGRPASVEAGWKEKVKEGEPVAKVLQEATEYHRVAGTLTEFESSHTYRWLRARAR